MSDEIHRRYVVKEKVVKGFLLHRTWTVFLSGAIAGDFQDRSLLLL
jgi:hypothetical protein